MTVTIPDDRTGEIRVSEHDSLVDTAIGLYKRKQVVAPACGGNVVAWILAGARATEDSDQLQGGRLATGSLFDRKGCVNGIL